MLNSKQYKRLKTRKGLGRGEGSDRAGREVIGRGEGGDREGRGR